MVTETLEAWVLHKTASGDSSARVTFFTREKGIISCLCKGGRAPKKQAILQPFSALWLAVDIRRDWYFVRQVERMSDNLSMKEHALFAGLYVNELLYYTLKPLASQPELFTAYVVTMQSLSTINERLAIEIVLRRFEWALLLASGYAFSFTKTIDAFAIHSELYYQFIAGEGFIESDTGIPGADLLALSQGCLEQLSVLKSAKLIMRQAIDQLLEGRVLKSRSLYPQTGNPSQ